MLSVKNTADAVSIRLEPNRSASWKQTRLAIICLTGFMLLIGMGWLLMGVWLIFPFVILDIVIFSYFFCQNGPNIMMMRKKKCVCKIDTAHF